MAVLFYLALLLSLVAAVAGALGRPRWYWAAGLLLYFASFLSGFSIGLYLLSLTFALLALALGHSLGRIRRFWHSLAAVCGGLVFWVAAVTLIDDAWLFLPFRLFL